MTLKLISRNVFEILKGLSYRISDDVKRIFHPIGIACEYLDTSMGQQGPYSL